MEKTKEINLVLNEYLEDKKFNFAKCILPNENEKISIIGKYNPQLRIKNGYIGLDENLEPIELYNASDYYYGVSPKLSESVLISAISQLKVTSSEKLKKFIQENRKFFFLHLEDKDYIYYFAEYICLRLLNLYGIKLNFNSELARDSFYENCSTSLSKGDIILKENKTILIIKGCPDEELLNYLDSKYVFYIDNKSIQVEEKNSQVVRTYRTMRIGEIYNEKKNIELIEGKIFYSGCLLKTLKIEKMDNANLNVDSYCIHFERTSFATVSCLNFHNNFLHHPFLTEKDSLLPIIEFFKRDDAISYEMYKQLEGVDCLKDKDRLIEIINDYLLSTSNTPQICVSGNLITKDNYLILTKRANQSIDSNFYYPSVNGNAEIADFNVEFYNNSVEEDYPEITLDHKRIDFNGELSRETFAELGISLDKRDWKPIGIVLFGRINNNFDSKNYSITERRIHFSFLFEQKLSEDLKAINEKQKYATEKYENQRIIGCRFNCYKSVPHMIRSLCSYFIKKILGIKSLVQAGLSIALFFILLAKGSYLGTIEKYVSLVFTFLVFLDSVCIILINLYDWWKSSKYKKEKKFIENKTNEIKIEKFINKLLEIDSYKDNLYPLTFIFLRLYIERKLKEFTKK